MWPNPQEAGDLITLTEKILNEKLHCFCSVKLIVQNGKINFRVTIQHVEANNIFNIVSVRTWLESLSKILMQELLNNAITRGSHQRCSIKKGFFKISQNSQENTCARDSFLKRL